MRLKGPIADLEREKEFLRLANLEHTPHRAVLYRTRKMLSEGYMKRLNQQILDGLNPAKKVVHMLQGYASPSETALGLQRGTVADDNM